MNLSLITSHNRERLPLLVLAVISLFWSYFYLADSALNDFGQDRPEWLLLVDVFITVPLICFVCIRDTKQAALKVLVYCSLLILLGSFIIPETEKRIWPWFESLRYALVAGFVLLELLSIATVVWAIKAAFTREQDLDQAIKDSIFRYFSAVPEAVGRLLMVETRVWSYLLFAHKVKPQHFEGEQHFYSDLKDGTQSNQLGFIMIMLFELPIVHLLLHYMVSPWAATVISVLTLIGMVFFIAEYRALGKRPLSLGRDKLIVRYSVGNPQYIAYKDIAEINFNKEYIKRGKGIKRYNLTGAPNVELVLSSGDKVYLGVNNPGSLVDALNHLR
ncbi:hypothetical protein G3R49_12150 [Shewanella sp. WXL01]|uniref:hypothetical protein n=1 Tax=Shewanella sp. WXL01 TaxID=2709721 RepID=UPI0014382D3F|nr:hypothetical protein [Shewanella sp. WXL01]NKF51308.1 hypothetical protein [Shewanella sp. WXL01]